MQKLKIWFTDFWPEIEIEDIFTPVLSKHYEVVKDERNPDIVFHSIFNRMSGISAYPNKMKVLWLAENYRPMQFSTNYSVSFDPHSKTNYRLPLWQAYILKSPSIKDKLYKRPNITQDVDDSFMRFCSFLVSNGSNFIRNSMFLSLNNYKRVHSYGKYLTNDSGLQRAAAPGDYWRDVKDEFFDVITHKFSICYENSCTPYYCTEKLMDGFLSGALPIYFGDPKATADFNGSSFINVNELNKAGKNVVDFVKEVDQNDDLYLSIRNQPVFTEKQKSKLEANLDGFEQYLLKIVNSI